MSNANLESITNDMEKENVVTAEALASTLLTKENIELKTEIPFADEVWNTALMKSLGDMIELDFLELKDVIEVTGSDGKSESANYNNYQINIKISVENKDGTKSEVKMPLAKYLGELYKRQIGYSEEYAVSHNRKGRMEVATSAERLRQEQRGKPPDMLGSLSGR